MHIHSQPELNAMLTNWQETILNYTFTINCKPSVLNVIPDALYRLYPLELKKTQRKQDHHTIMSYMHILQTVTPIAKK